MIRDVKVSDIEEIVELWEKTGLWHPTKDLSKVIENVSVSKGLFLVYIIDEKIVGTIRGVWDGTFPMLHEFAVLTEYQNKGIGSQLLNELISRIKLRGGKSIFCIVRPDAEKFYTNKHNFKYMCKCFVKEFGEDIL